MTSSSIVHVAQVDHFRAEMGRLGLGDIGRPDDLVGQHQVHHPHPGCLGLGPELGHLVGGHKAQVHQHVD